MHRVIYEFQVHSDCAPEFENVVADWFRVMRGCDGFIAISLFRDSANDNRFCAISDWASASAYGKFHDSPEHAQVAEATAQLFSTQDRQAFDLIYQVTMRECDN